MRGLIKYRVRKQAKLKRTPKNPSSIKTLKIKMLRRNLENEKNIIKAYWK